MAGLVPTIHVLTQADSTHVDAAETWMPGTRPGMTKWMQIASDI
jgi:hypothetical protein